jgi:acyl-CoA thioesterase
MESSFALETRVEGRGDGLYGANIGEAWNLRPLPQGGLVTALALRSMAEELDDADQRLRVLHTTFVAQVTDGPVEIQVEVLRRGRSVSQLRAEVANVGASRGHVTTAVYGSPRQGFNFVDLDPPPSVPPPDACRSFRDPLPPGVEGFVPMPFWSTRVEGRSALGHTPWEKYEPSRAERVLWYRFDEPPFLHDGTIDPLSLVVLVDTMPGAAGEKIGSQERPWFAPSIDLTVHLLDECRSPWVLGHNRARHAGDGYASADMALWDCGPDGQEEPRLVAYATQLFLFTYLS